MWWFLSQHPTKRVLPKSTLWRRAYWFSTSEVSCKKAHAHLQMNSWNEMTLLISSSSSVHEPFYNSPQIYWTSQPSSKELIWARQYYLYVCFSPIVETDDPYANWGPPCVKRKQVYLGKQITAVVGLPTLVLCCEYYFLIQYNAQTFM